jgi:hypothetical protein
MRVFCLTKVGAFMWIDSHGERRSFHNVDARVLGGPRVAFSFGHAAALLALVKEKFFGYIPD